MIQPLIDISRKQALSFAFFLVIYEFLVYIGNDMIMPGMLSVIQSFHAPATAVATSLTAYVLGGASLQLFLGPISDRFGRRPVMLFGACWFSCITLLLPYVETMNQFLGLRFLQGMGLCYINVVGYALLQEIFNEEDAIRLVSVMVNVAILAPLFGPLAGAEFLELGLGSWHGIFYWIGGLSILAFIGLYLTMPESIGCTKLDGQVISRQTLSISSILKKYTSLLKHRVFVFGTLAYGLLGVPCLVWIGLSPVILVHVGQKSLLEYGLWQLPVFGAFILGNFLLAHLVKYFKVAQLSTLGSAIVLLGMILLSVIPLWLGYSVHSMMPGLIIYFIGYGLCASALNRFILFVTQISTGTTSALISSVSMLFLAFGNEIGNDVFNHYDLKALIGYLALIGFLYLICIASSLYQRRDIKALGVDNL